MAEGPYGGLNHPGPPNYGEIGPNGLPELNPFAPGGWGRTTPPTPPDPAYFPDEFNQYVLENQGGYSWWVDTADPKIVESYSASIDAGNSGGGDPQFVPAAADEIGQSVDPAVETFDTPSISPDMAASFESRILKGIEDGFLSSEDADFLREVVRNGGVPASQGGFDFTRIDQEIRQRISEGKDEANVDQTREDNAAIAARATERIGETRVRGEDFFGKGEFQTDENGEFVLDENGNKIFLGYKGGEIERLQGLIDNPGTVRSDKDYGNMLSVAEAGINAQVNQVKSVAARSVSNTGLRASGKVSDQVRNVEQVSAQQKGSQFSNILQGIEGRNDNLTSSANSFFSGLDDKQLSVDSGELSGAFNLNSFDAALKPSGSFGNLYGTNFDITGLNLGQQNFETSQFWNNLFSFIGANNEAFGTFTAALPGNSNG